MGIFGKKTTFAFSEILKGLEQAISSTISTLQTRQMDNLSHFWMKDGKPVTKKIQIGNREFEVPLMALTPHNHLIMDNVEVKFKAHIRNVSSHSTPDTFKANNALSYAELQVKMDDVQADADNLMEITIHFKMQDATEEVNNLVHECNKRIE